MRLQYITDNLGHRNAILLSMTDWEDMQKKLKELKALRIYKQKTAFLVGLKEALEESKLHSEGKIKLQTAKDFLNEL